MTKDLFLGLDASTQGLKAVIIGDSVVDTISVSYDEIQPHDYELKNGVWSLDNNVVYGSPVVWVMALEEAMKELKNRGHIARIAALSGSGQQHGSVYLGMCIEDIVKGLLPDEPLVSQLERDYVFSRTENINGKGRVVSPIWMDSSTAIYMNQITERIGGLAELVEATGCGQFERFTGPQIKKFAETFPDDYTGTVQILLVSSFHAGLLSGIAAIEPGDAAGMSLMDIRTRKWHPDLVRITAPQLERLLPEIVDPTISLGKNSEYFRAKYGLDAHTFPWSGDNPNSLIGVGAVVPGKVAISLGTSDTCFGYIGRELKLDKTGEVCVFGAPTHFMDNMYLGCWKNGSLVREKIAIRFKMGWDGVSSYLLATEPDSSKIGVYWFDAEITPNAPANTIIRTDGFSQYDNYNVKALIEGRAMSMLIRLKRMGVEPKEIYVTGGASKNDGILQIIADVSGATVYRQQSPDSAALGAALRAKHGYLKHNGEPPVWEEVVAPFVKVTKTFMPNMARHEVYKNMLPKYEAFEQRCAEQARR